LLGFDGAGAIRFSYVMRGIVAPKVGVVPWQLRQFFASTASTSQGRPFAVGVGVVDVGVTVGDGPASEAGSTPAVVPQAKATADPRTSKRPRPGSERARMGGSMRDPSTNAKEFGDDAT